MTLPHSLIPYHIIHEILNFLPLSSLVKIKTTSIHFNKYFNKRINKQIIYFNKIVFKNSNSQLFPIYTPIKSKLPNKFAPNFHIIYNILKKHNQLQNNNKIIQHYRLISPTTLYQHTLPRYSTLSGVCPFIKIPTAMGFYKLISAYPLTENPEFFVIDILGGTSSRDRAYNMNIYYTKTLTSYKRILTFHEMFNRYLLM